MKLFMVDRDLQKKSFWSDRLDDVKIFGSRAGAEKVLAKLKHNNPKVVSIQRAKEIIKENRKLLVALSDMGYDDINEKPVQVSPILEMLDAKINHPFGEWDGHKGALI